MSILGLMSFDAVDATRIKDEFDISNVPGGTTYNITAGRYGGQCFGVTNFTLGNYFAAGFVNTTSSRTLVQGVDIYVYGTGGSYVEQSIFVLMDGNNLAPGAFTTMQVSCFLKNDMSLEVYRGSNLTTLTSGTLLGSLPAATIPKNKWVNLSWKVFIDSTAGSVQLQIEGVTVLTLTGINTQATSNNFAANASMTAGEGVFYDNFYVLDGTGSSYNTLIGTQAMDVHLPDASGTNTNWTPLSAPNYSQVNDYANLVTYNASPVPDDGATYIFSDAGLTNLADTYPVNLFGSRGPSAIQFTFRVSSTVASGNRVLQSLIYDGTTIFTGSNITLDVADTNWHSYRDLSFVLDDPSTSGTWNSNLLNARQFGVKSINNSSGGGDSAVAQISQVKVTRMFPTSNLLVANHPMWITG